MLLAWVTYLVDAPKVMTRCRNASANVDVNADVWCDIVIDVHRVELRWGGRG